MGVSFTNENALLLKHTHEDFAKNISPADAITENNSFLSALKSRGRIKTGESGEHLSWKVRTAKSTTTKGWRYMDAVAFQVEDTYQAAKLNWKGYDASYIIPEWNSSANKAPNAIFNYQKQKLNELQSDILEKIEDGLFDDGTGETGNRGIEGLPAFVATTGTYANIAQTNSYWQATATDGNAGANTEWRDDTMERMTTAYLAGCRGGGKAGTTGKPQLWITTRAGWATVQEVLQKLERFPGKDGKYSGGATEMAILGIPIIFSDSSTASVIYGLNLDMLDLCVSQDSLVKGKFEDSLSPIGTAGVFYTKLALRCRSPRYQVKITNVD